MNNENEDMLTTMKMRIHVNNNENEDTLTTMKMRKCQQQ